MKQADLNINKIIDCLINNERLRLRGEHSFFSCFGLNERENDNKVFDVRTLERKVEELCDEGVFNKDASGYYTINERFFSPKKDVDPKEFNELLRVLVENNEFEAYYTLKKLFGDAGVDLLENIDINRYESAIKDKLENLECRADILSVIHNAINENLSLKIKYKGNNEKKNFKPFFIVISRKGGKSYLFCEKRNKLVSPLELKGIESAELAGKRAGTGRYNKTDCVEDIDKLWDIDMKEAKVKILFRQEGKKYYEEAFNMMNTYFKGSKETKDGYIFEGEVFGVNDFKSWLRQYIDVCIVLEPKDLREEFYKKLLEKKERYTNDKDR